MHTFPDYNICTAWHSWRGKRVAFREAVCLKADISCVDAFHHPKTNVSNSLASLIRATLSYPAREPYHTRPLAGNQKIAERKRQMDKQTLRRNSQRDGGCIPKNRSVVKWTHEEPTNTDIRLFVLVWMEHLLFFKPKCPSVIKRGERFATHYRLLIKFDSRSLYFSRKLTK